MPEVIAFPEQRFTQVRCQCVGDAIPEVQSGRMAAAFAEICVSLPGQTRLALGNGLYDELGFLDYFVKSSADDRIPLGVKDNPAFEITGSREPSRLGAGDGPRVHRRVVLLPEDRDDRRRIDDHAGSPRSS